MAVVQQSLTELIQAEQVATVARIRDRFESGIYLNTAGQTSAAAVTGGAVVAPNEDCLQRLEDLNAQMAIALDLLVDA